jgi:hypothetical protein
LLDPWHRRILQTFLVEVLEASRLRPANPARKGHWRPNAKYRIEFPFIFTKCRLWLSGKVSFSAAFFGA